jgi:hypothetical protein
LEKTHKDNYDNQLDFFKKLLDNDQMRTTLRRMLSKREATVERRFTSIQGKGKGKAIPLQALTGPEGSRTLRLPDFKTIGT